MKRVHPLCAISSWRNALSRYHGNNAVPRSDSRSGKTTEFIGASVHLQRGRLSARNLVFMAFLSSSTPSPLADDGALELKRSKSVTRVAASRMADAVPIPSVAARADVASSSGWSNVSEPRRD